MKNKEIAQILYRMASLLEMTDENRFRIRAYSNAAQVIDDLTEDIEERARQGTLTELPGVGQGIADKIAEYCRTGKIAEYEKLQKKYPRGVLDLMLVSGLGPKRARFLYENLKIDSPEKLKKAAEQGRLSELKGFGQKLVENLLQALSSQGPAFKRLLISDASAIAQSVVARMRKNCRSLREFVPSGSLRRWKESIGDLDFLCTSDDPKEIAREFAGMPAARKVLARGDTKVTIIHEDGVQCDLRVVPPESFGAALLYFTGSKGHNVALRELALKKGFTINEYGLFSLTNKKKPVAGRTEEEIYSKLGLEFIPPELRENRGEIAAAQKRKLPRLVEEKDIRGDFHNHTKLSDGYNTLEEMAEKAESKGWEWFVSADHSESLKVARGLTRETLMKKKAEIRRINKGRKGFTVLLGSEVDILSDGGMDYDAATLREIDFVVGSVHTGFKQPEEQLTRRIVKAMENPNVDIIGHLTGRLIGSREPYPVNFQQVLDAALRTDTALEINGQPHRMELYDTYAKAAGEKGAMIALDTDAHSTRQLDFMTYAVATARRAWLTKEQILNCRSLDELRAWKGAAA